MKICKDCKLEKDIEEFMRYNNYRNNRCNPCRLKYTRMINDKKTKIRKNYPLW